MLADLLAEIEAQGWSDDGSGPDPVVSLELFFEGNDDLASIGCNLIDHPGPADFYATLRAIRAPHRRAGWFARGPAVVGLTYRTSNSPYGLRPAAGAE